MKLKFTYLRASGPVDLVATVDAATTVGDLAGFLLAADPTRRAGLTATTGYTLVLADREPRPLDPRQPVADSAMRSGAAVTVEIYRGDSSGSGRPAAAVIRVLSGLDAGKEFHIPTGSAEIGRERGCEIRLTDDLVSRRHARLNVGDTIEVVDLGSANGVLIDDLAVPRSILRATDVIQVGDTKLSVRLLHATARPTTDGPSVRFVRSPRVEAIYAGRSFEAPEPPERARGQRFPVVSLLAPLLMGAVLYFVTKNPTSLIFIALSPLMLIGNNLEGRLARRSEFRQALAEFEDDVQSLLDDLQRSATEEGAARLGEQPSAQECADAIRSGNPLLWQRRPGECHFGVARLGLGRRPSRTSVEYPRLKRSIRVLHTQLIERTSQYSSLDSVPVVGDLNTSALGVAGPRALACDVARGLVLQIAALHSPAELAVALVASTHSVPEWEWLKWLPHTSTAQSPVQARLLAASAGTAGALVAEVEELINQRSDPNPVSPALLLIVESDAPVEFARLVAIAERGPRVGIYVIWIGDEIPAIPAACATFLELGRESTTATIGYVHEGVSVSPIAAEQVTVADASELARQLAPIIDLGARTADASDLPRAVGLLGLTGSELAVSAESVLERWTESRSIITGPLAPAGPSRHAGTLRAVIGQTGADRHTLDLRADGPHALVGGTTGAGKSELLQTWILAMAAAHSPQRLTFLLVDYKGGSAFHDCVDLPHTVGLVTDLSPHMVRRALTSLSAELRYREHLLARHAVKDLISLEKQGAVDAPPSLVLVVDEFAALVAEVPEFVDGVVNVAQRGRSLGLHLILATQRPAGVIKDNLRANTNLRIALRMADESDSTDVLGSPDAAFFDPAVPGRAVSKTGPGRLVSFQTGYVGGWAGNNASAPELLVEELSIAGPAQWSVPEPAKAVAVDPGPSDIRRIVDRIGEAAAMAEIPEPRKPWLPDLRPAYDLADQDVVPSRRRDTELVFGVRDSPETQSQPTVAFYPDRDGSMVVYGTGGSGKTALLRTIAIAAGFTVRGGPCHVYGIDFGALGLAVLSDLPHVGSIIAGADHERITRLLGWLRGLIDERALRYSRVNAGTVTDYRASGNAPEEARILLLVDGVTAFRSAYETADRLRWFELFTSIVADGRPVGVHVVLSSDQRGGLTTALASAVQARVVLRMANSEDYGLLGVPSDVIATTAEPGRGLVGRHEVQVAVLGGEADPAVQATAVSSFAESMRRNGISDAPPIRSLPERVPLASLPAELDGLPVIGLASETLSPATFEPSGGFMISGPPLSGRTEAVRSLAVSLVRATPTLRLYYFGSARSSLATLDCWAGTATVQSSDQAADRILQELGQSVAVAIVIENISQFVGTSADLPLQSLVKHMLNDGQLVVVEGETSTLTGSTGLLGAVKAARAGLALAPDQADGMTIYRTQFPRSSPAERIPGRALLVRAGRTMLVQVGLVER